MKENKYDDPVFFQKYSQMTRSQKGLSGAGEWESLRQILPDFSGQKVLDLGCGYGWHCLYAADHGASQVIGCDISERMLAVARKKNAHPHIEYRHVSFEDAIFPSDTFDTVLCSLMLHYLPSYEEFLLKVRRWLRTEGSLFFTVEHPIFTAQGPQDWYYNESGEILHFPVDHYFSEGVRKAVFLGESVVKYHRTLETYINGLLKHGFTLQQVIEPRPSEKMLRDIPEMADELRRPMMLIVSAKKVL